MMNFLRGGGGDEKKDKGWEKFNAPPNFIQDEEQLKTMEPTPRVTSNMMMNRLDELIRRSTDPAETNQYHVIKADLMADKALKGISDDFCIGFIQWILGKSEYNVVHTKAEVDPNGTALVAPVKFKTPWGNKPYTHLPDVKEFLDGFVDGRMAVVKYVAKLKARYPKNLTDLWFWYKYLVREEEINDGIINYATFLAPYDFTPPENIPSDPLDGGNPNYPYNVNGDHSSDVKPFDIGNPNPPPFDPEVRKAMDKNFNAALNQLRVLGDSNPVQSLQTADTLLEQLDLLVGKNKWAISPEKAQELNNLIYQQIMSVKIAPLRDSLLEKFGYGPLSNGLGPQVNQAISIGASKVFDDMEKHLMNISADMKSGLSGAIAAINDMRGPFGHKTTLYDIKRAVDSSKAKVSLDLTNELKEALKNIGKGKTKNYNGAYKPTYNDNTQTHSHQHQHDDSKTEINHNYPPPQNINIIDEEAPKKQPPPSAGPTSVSVIADMSGVEKKMGEMIKVIDDHFKVKKPAKEKQGISVTVDNTIEYNNEKLDTYFKGLVGDIKDMIDKVPGAKSPQVPLDERITVAIDLNSVINKVDASEKNIIKEFNKKRKEKIPSPSPNKQLETDIKDIKNGIANVYNQLGMPTPVTLVDSRAPAPSEAVLTNLGTMIKDLKDELARKKDKKKRDINIIDSRPFEKEEQYLKALTTQYENLLKQPEAKKEKLPSAEFTRTIALLQNLELAFGNVSKELFSSKEDREKMTNHMVALQKEVTDIHKLNPFYVQQMADLVKSNTDLVAQIALMDKKNVDELEMLKGRIKNNEAELESMRKLSRVDLKYKQEVQAQLSNTIKREKIQNVTFYNSLRNLKVDFQRTLNEVSAQKDTSEVKINAIGTAVNSIGTIIETFMAQSAESSRIVQNDIDVISKSPAQQPPPPSPVIEQKMSGQKTTLQRTVEKNLPKEKTLAELSHDFFNVHPSRIENNNFKPPQQTQQQQQQSFSGFSSQAAADTYMQQQLQSKMISGGGNISKREFVEQTREGLVQRSKFEENRKKIGGLIDDDDIDLTKYIGRFDEGQRGLAEESEREKELFDILEQYEEDEEASTDETSTLNGLIAYSELLNEYEELINSEIRGSDLDSEGEKMMEDAVKSIDELKRKSRNYIQVLFRGTVEDFHRTYKSLDSQLNRDTMDLATANHIMKDFLNQARSAIGAREPRLEARYSQFTEEILTDAAKGFTKEEKSDLYQERLQNFKDGFGRALITALAKQKEKFDNEEKLKRERLSEARIMNDHDLNMTNGLNNQQYQGSTYLNNPRGIFTIYKNGQQKNISTKGISQTLAKGLYEFDTMDEYRTAVETLISERAPEFGAYGKTTEQAEIEVTRKALDVDMGEVDLTTFHPEPNYIAKALKERRMQKKRPLMLANEPYNKQEIDTAQFEVGQYGGFDIQGAYGERNEPEHQKLEKMAGNNLNATLEMLEVGTKSTRAEELMETFAESMDEMPKDQQAGMEKDIKNLYDDIIIYMGSEDAKRKAKFRSDAERDAAGLKVRISRSTLNESRKMELFIRANKLMHAAGIV